VFIEDTAVVVSNTKTAIVARIGAAARQGEEPPVAAQLQRLGYDLKHLQVMSSCCHAVSALFIDHQLSSRSDNRCVASSELQMQRLAGGLLWR
jgi:N-dimethylarginine dimethylaminohydrolase